MFNNLRTAKYLAFIFSLASAIILIFPANAETEQTQYDFLEDIEAGKDRDWQFSSETESLSIKDEISELQQYSISEIEENFVGKTVVKEEKWGNRGDVEDFSIDANVYEY